MAIRKLTVGVKVLWSMIAVVAGLGAAFSWEAAQAAKEAPVIVGSVADMARLWEPFVGFWACVLLFAVAAFMLWRR